MREKKKFESALDDAVAQGLNAAVNILMVSVEHLITTRQGLRDFTPDRDDDFDLTPTRACVEAIETLKQHCDMLRGSTDKQILEVFNQEVGIRLHGCVPFNRQVCLLLDPSLADPRKSPRKKPVFSSST